eukprot:CAMPEP_0176448014 /NCGR_PEP_ID=MMETSP0127-20121128/25474_1 /TAXON_ID=938130 /ORGANISM="Platyophrya macrostoma, Strain WH" /LENGTH=352 /DNA_ID=CAMNT_0017834769 /DNA_START=42 /DNA_END=1101 /DNA_ORIENTATION=+
MATKGSNNYNTPYPLGDDVENAYPQPDSDIQKVVGSNLEDHYFFKSGGTPDEFIQSSFETPEDEKMMEEADYRDLPQAKLEMMEIETKKERYDEIEEEYNEFPSINASALHKLIEKVLQGQEPIDQELQELSDVEKALLQSIKEKKACTDEERPNKRKRVEEKQKLFFKATLKYSEKKYFSSAIKNSKKKVKKRQLDQQGFYETYFAETAKRNKCDITNFYHPNKKLKGGSKKAAALKTKGTAGLKSFNSTYIDLILSSEQFRNDAYEFMEGCFVQEYIKTRYQKIEKLLKQMEKYLKELETLILKIKENVMNNSKSKLPWSNSELEEAKLFAKQRIIKAKNVLEMAIEQDL